MRESFFRLLITFLLPAMLLLSCSSDSGSPSGPDNDGDDNSGTGGDNASWVAGESVSYTVSGSAEVSVSDSLSGATFVVTPGEGATLTVTALEDGPELPFEGELFNVDFTGSQTLTVELAADPDGGDTFLMTYGTPEGTHIDERTSEEFWYCLPPYSEEDGVLKFGVSLDEAGTARRAAGGVSSNNFAIVKAGNGSGDFNHLRTIHKTVQEVIDAWLNSLPGDKRTWLSARIEALPRTVMWASGGNSYKHVTGFFSPRVILFFTPEAGLSSIAHETGHYICHAMMGDDAYDEFYSLFPTDWLGSAVSHDIGDYRAGRKEMLESYPYISMIFTTGDLIQYDLTSATKFNNVADMTNNADPSKVDYPSHEAFGAAMLMSLRRSTSTVYTFSKIKGWETAKVPVVGASWGDVLGILTNMPKNVNELREDIQDFLDTRGADRYKFSAMMEPIGWSYNGQGTIVDNQGKAFSGAYVQNIMQTGEEEYRTTASATTDSTGIFYLPRLFPGSSILRVFYNTAAGKDSTDYPLTIDWKTQTNDTRKLGEIKLERMEKHVELKFDHNYVITPGVRAQNTVSVKAKGYLTGPENMIVSPTFSSYSGVLDIQSIFPLNQEAMMDMEIEYTLSNGTSWETSLSQGDYGDAVKAVTELSNPKFKLIEYYGPNYTESVRYLDPPDLMYYINAADGTGKTYRADIRLEWDYTQTYYKSDGSIAGSVSDKAGVYIIHIWRDLSTYL